MVAELRKIDKSLYETDYNLWVMETVDKLQRRDLDALDWENLIEEVAALSRRDKRKVRSLLKRLLEHLLKLGFWRTELSNNHNHWRGEVRNFRHQIRYELQDSPSLKPYLMEVFNQTYQESREVVSDQSGLTIDCFPENPLGNLDQVLDEAWFPAPPED